MLNYKAHFFKDARDKSPVENFMRDLPKKDRAKVSAWICLLEEKGPEMPSQYCTKLQGHADISELKIKYRSNAYRIFFFYENEKIVLVHGFIKKTYETPQKDIDIAIKRMNEWRKKGE